MANLPQEAHLVAITSAFLGVSSHKAQFLLVILIKKGVFQILEMNCVWTASISMCLCPPSDVCMSVCAPARKNRIRKVHGLGTIKLG